MKKQCWVVFHLKPGDQYRKSVYWEEQIALQHSLNKIFRLLDLVSNLKISANCFLSRKLFQFIWNFVSSSVVVAANDWHLMVLLQLLLLLLSIYQSDSDVRTYIGNRPCQKTWIAKEEDEYNNRSNWQ